MTLNRSYEATPVRAAVRFPLRLDVVLHTTERAYPGVTEDVSANGLLFFADELPEVGAEVRFELTMPAAVMGGTKDVLLNCSGRIIRHHRIAEKLLAAAVIDEYSFRG